MNANRATPLPMHLLPIELGEVSAEVGQGYRFVVGATDSVFLMASPLGSDVKVMNMDGEVSQSWQGVAPDGAVIVEFIKTSEGTFALYSDGVLPIGDDGTPGEYIPFNSSSYGDMRRYAIKDNKVMILARKTRDQASLLLFDLGERSLSVVQVIDDHARLGYSVVAVGDGFLLAWSTSSPINGQFFDLEGSPVGSEVELWQRDEAMAFMLSSQSTSTGGAVIAFMESKRSYANPTAFTISPEREISQPRRYSTARDHGSTLWMTSGGQGQLMFWAHNGRGSDYTGRGALHMELVDSSEYPKYHRFAVNGPISQLSSAVCNDKLLVVGHEWIQDENEEYTGMRRLAGVFDRTALAGGASVSTHTTTEGVEDAQ